MLLVLFKRLILMACLLGVFASSSSVLAEGTDVIVGLANFPSHLDPRKFTSFTNRAIIKSLHRTLIKANPDGSLIGDLAYRWKIKNDFTRYEFCLHKQTFSDGSTLSFDDVKYSFEALKNARYGFQAFRFMKSINPQLEPMSDHKQDFCFAIRLSRPMPRFLYTISDPEFSILKQGFEANQKFVALGRYRVELFDPIRRNLTISMNEPFNPKFIRRFLFVAVDSADEAISMLSKKQIDIFFGWRDYQKINTLPSEIQVSSIPSSTFVHLFFNASNPIFHDRDFRRDLVAQLNKAFRKGQQKNPYLIPLERIIPRGLLPPSYYKSRVETTEEHALFAQRWSRKLSGRKIRLVGFLNECNRATVEQLNILFNAAGAQFEYIFDTEKYGEILSDRDYDLIFGGISNTNVGAQELLSLFDNRRPFSLTNFNLEHQIDALERIESENDQATSLFQAMQVAEDIESLSIAKPGFTVHLGVLHNPKIFFPSSRFTFPFSLTDIRINHKFMMSKERN